MTTAVSALLDDLGGRGVHLYLGDGQLRAVAAKDAMTGEVRQLIAAHREALIAVLRERDGPPAPAGADGVRLATERLILRPVRAGDRDDMLAYRGRADVHRYLEHDPLTANTVGAFLAQRAAKNRPDRDGDHVLLAVERDGTVIGDIAVNRHPDAQGELGWVFHPDHSGRGYATEAAAAAIDWGFGELRFHRIWARLNPGNTASARLCERLGMRREALLHEESRFRGEWADLAIYALIDREWHRP